jgi:hypothetical protein
MKNEDEIAKSKNQATPKKQAKVSKSELVEKYNQLSETYQQLLKNRDELREEKEFVLQVINVMFSNQIKLEKGVIPESNDLNHKEYCFDVDGNYGQWITKNFDTAGDYIKDIAEQYYDGSDPIGKTHVREGVVVRILNRPKFCAYKHKNWSFKALEGIVKVEAEVPDMEEADGEEEAEN